MGRHGRWIAVLALLGPFAVSHGAGQNVCDGVSHANNTTLTQVAVATGLTGRPLFVTAPPGDVSRFFTVEQNGFIRYVQRTDPPSTNTLFLDISGRLTSASDEQGLLGLAFDPSFSSNGLFYVDYTRAGDGHTIVSRFRTLDGTPNTLGDPNSETILLRVVQPEANHNGGMVAFGPDGYLYIGMGDGGGGGDGHGVCGNGQNLQALLGKLLRIDPHGGAGNAPDCGLDAGPYTVPASNPLADGPGGNCDEIWAYGLRNPWRFSFDAGNGDLYIGDVGQACWEEIDYATSASTGGQNYGWRLFEGRHCYNSVQGCGATSSPAGCAPACSDPVPTGDPVPNGTVLPVWDYDHGGGCAITGGYVYRGCRMPNLLGTYFYGDYCAGSVLSLQVVGGVATNPRSDWALGAGAGLTSFGTDAQGEIYFTHRSPGTVYKILPPLSTLEVSGVGAADQFLLSRNGDWTWEDLHLSSTHPITAYRVYRADVLDGVYDVEVFNCVHTTATRSWPLGGDPQNPGNSQMFAYIVTALNGTQQTSPGGSPPRTLTTQACPP